MKKNIIIKSKFINSQGQILLKEGIVFTNPVNVSKGGVKVGEAFVRFEDEKLVGDFTLAINVDGYPCIQLPGIKPNPNNSLEFPNAKIHDITLLDKPVDISDIEVKMLSEYRDVHQ